jgi:peptidoglycan/LPS O-acetylase OafA/YrhL
MQQKENRILELDALRGIAALSVFLYHASIYYKESIYFSFFRFGLTGVDLFFIISGFVIFSSIQNKTRLQFLQSRLLRLFPTYWIAVTFTFTLIFIKYYQKGILTLLPLKQYIINLSMIQEFFKIENLDGPYWTLYIELFFYFLVFILIKKEKMLFAAISMIILITVISRVNWINIPYPLSILATTPISAHAPLFLIGMIFYKLHKTKSLIYLTPIVLVFISQVLIYRAHYIWIQNTDINFSEHITLLVLYLVVFSMFVFNKLKFICNSYLIKLGKISYALYLIHQYLTTEIIEFYIVNKKHFSLGATIFLISLPLVLFISFYVSKISDWIGLILKKKLFFSK